MLNAKSTAQKRLERGNLNRASWRRTKRKNPVSIIVGIICQDGIVLACDSQTTAGSAKRTDSDKISHLTFGGKDIIVAEAGDSTLSARAVELLQKQFSLLTFDDWRKPADAAQDAVKILKQELIEVNNWKECQDFAQEYHRENPFSLMLAYFHNKAPYLYVLNSVPGFATREWLFATIGCGGTVAEFILSKADVKSMTRMEALIAAIYTVEEVKRVDTYCGGPTKAAVLSEDKVMFSETESKPIIKAAIETMEGYDQELRAKWYSLLREIIDRTKEKYKQLATPPTPKPSSPPRQ